MPSQLGSSNAGRSRVLNRKSLLDTHPLSASEIESLFQKSEQLRDLFSKQASKPSAGNVSSNKVVACLFFEPSTRTRMSFQTAAYRLGHQVLAMESTSSSSLSKGESYVDTVLNIAAMNPDAIVIRYGKSTELDALLPTLQIPVLNAGSGTAAHPTQALLDAYTIQRELGSVRGQRVLIVGDIIHSRVARSNFDVLNKLGAEIGVCGPESLMPNVLADSELAKIRVFKNLDEAVEWPTVYMGLRIQLERHEASELQLDSMADYHRHFGLGPSRLKKLAKDVIIMHPGPINHGVEFSSEVMSDPRNRVLEQVSNGVLIRAALLDLVLNEQDSNRSGQGKSE